MNKEKNFADEVSMNAGYYNQTNDKPKSSSLCVQRSQRPEGLSAFIEDRKMETRKDRRIADLRKKIPTLDINSLLYFTRKKDWFAALAKWQRSHTICKWYAGFGWGFIADYI